MDGFRLRNIFNTVDLIIVSYLFDTLILSFFIREPGGWIHPVLFRLLAFFTIGIILYHDNSYPSKASRIIRYFYPVVLLSYLYGDTAELNHIFFSEPLDNILVNLEQNIFGYQPALEFSKAMPQKWFSELMNFGYFSYYIFIFGIAAAAFKKHNEHKVEIMFLIIGSFIFYYVFFIIFPTYGPQFYILNGDLPPPDGVFSRLVHLAQQIGEVPTGAFPSSHVGMMLVFCYISWKYLKKWFAVTALFTIIITFATVYIKAHYAIDIIAGYISAPVVIFLANKYYSQNKKILNSI